MKHKTPYNASSPPKEITPSASANNECTNTPKRTKIESETEDWLITYSDAITLLLAFFVLILSVSEINQSKFEQITKSINEDLLEKEEYRSPLLDLENSLSFVLRQNQIALESAITTSDNFLKINLPSEILFESGSSELESGSVQLLSEIADRIKSFNLNNFDIEIEGHSDDSPINSPKYPSNWELSSSRAIAVLRIFIQRGVQQTKLKAIGYADTKPKVPNRDNLGNPIKNNQKLNRRVEILIAKKRFL